MHSAEYWRQRAEAVQRLLMRNAERSLPELDAVFRAAKADLEREIARWFSRFAENNSISLIDAKRLLNSSQLEEFRWTVSDYIRHAEENCLDDKWVKQLENASARYHISRYEALRIQLRQYAETVYGRQLDMTENLLADIYREGYYRTMHMAQIGLNVGFVVQRFDADALTRILKKPWTTDGKTFRDRCWTNKQLLSNTLQTQLTRGIVAGTPPQSLIDTMQKSMDVARYKAGQLVMTESAYFSAQAQKDCFDALEVEEYEVIGTLDTSTCAVCGDMDKKVFRQADYEAGVTAPPFHPNCRCTTAPHFEDWDELGISRTRAARDPETGKTTDVGDMNYRDWKEKYVVRSLQNTDDSGIIQTKIQDNSVVDPMNEKLYTQIKDSLHRNGVTVIEAKGDDLKYLTTIGAEASYGHGYIMHIGKIPSASAMFEEIIHSTQSKKFGEFISDDPIELFAREIAANRKLLKYSKAYGFTQTDRQDIARNLKIWEEKFLEKVGVPYDQADYKR